MPQRIGRMDLEAITEGIKASPPAIVTATAFIGGVSINHIVGAATVLYILLQAGYLIWKWRRDWKLHKEGLKQE